MESISLDELREMAREAKDDSYLLNDGECPKLYLHWTAGHYGQYFDDYHLLVDDDGSIIATTDDLTEKLAHTYMRNTGSIGISMCCCAFATTEDLGDEPPTDEMIDAMAQVIAVLCQELEIPCDMYYVMTHGEAADNVDGEEPCEPYGLLNGAERWDLAFLGTPESPEFITDYEDERTGGNVLRRKANEYIAKWQGEG